jgi:hypothetical protein
MESRAFIVGLIVGILATVTMDVVAVIALRLGIAGGGPRRTGPDLIGRWIGYLLRGKFRHTDILRTPPLRGELLLGLAYWLWRTRRRQPSAPSSTERPPRSSPGFSCSHHWGWAGWAGMRRVMLIWLA